MKMNWIDQFKANLLEVLCNPGQPRDELGRCASTGGSSASTTELMTSKVYGEILEGWDSRERRNIALTAVETFEDSIDPTTGIAEVDGIVLRDNGELVGVTVSSSWKYDGDNYLSVEYLATKRSGYGRQMMQNACQQAAAKGVGVFLHPTETAMGFYEKLGMKYHEQIDAFTFTADQTSQFAEQGFITNISKELEQELKDLEPEDGVFTRPTKEEPDDELD